MADVGRSDSGRPNHCADAQLYLFDLDGTLADTKRDLATAVNLTFADLGVPELPVEVIAGYVGDGVRTLIAKSLGESESPRYREAVQIFRGHYLKHLLDSTRFYPGMEALLRRLSRDGKQTVVVTNKPVEYTDQIIDGLGARGYFDLVIGSNPSTRLKPDPQMILQALEHIGAPPDRTVMVGDGVNDIIAARAAAVRVCAVGYGLTPPDALRAAAPDYFCQGIEELTACLIGAR
jgi:phosphoglycolate phosphatase